MANITRIKNITELIKLRETNSTDEKTQTMARTYRTTH